MSDHLTDPLLGWPFDQPPIRHGVVNRGVSWAIKWNENSHTPAINGYARIPWEGHPWSGCADYNDLDVSAHGGLTYGPHPEYDLAANYQALVDMTKDTDHPLVPYHDTAKIRPIPALTFTDVGGWVGFDTLHAWDYWSDEELATVGVVREAIPGLSDSVFDKRLPDSIDWTVQRVIAEAKSLAHQIAAVSVTLRKPPRR